MLALQLSIFVFLVAAIVFLARHGVQFGQRLTRSALSGAGVALCGVLAAIVVTGWTGPDVARLAFSGFGLLLVGGCITIVVYAGSTLGERAGGYWMRRIQPGAWGRLGGVVAAAVAAAILFNLALSRLLHTPLEPIAVSSARGLIAYLLAQVAYASGEEFFYRGWVQSWLATLFGAWRFGPAAAIAISAVVFMAQHVNPAHQLVMSLTSFSAGLLFGFLFYRFGWFASALSHFLANLALGLVVPHLLH